MKKAPKMKVKHGKQVSTKVGKFASGGFMKSFSDGFKTGEKLKDDADTQKYRDAWTKNQLAISDKAQDAEQDADD